MVLMGINRIVVTGGCADEGCVEAGAWRRRAQERPRMLATMVLMGINRIVVTGGRIEAATGFRIESTDTAVAESAG